MDYRLGLDVGTTSIGWCLLELEQGEPVRLERAGVRIFSDGRDAKTKEPLAVHRRTMRGQRRRRDRYLRRRENLMRLLISHALMPADEKARKEIERLNPYALRSEGLDRKLSLHELGRALFHINQRRGFKSNRKSDKKNNEKGAMKQGIQQTRNKIETAGCRTLGEYLFKEIALKKNHRFPLRFKHSLQDGKVCYPLYAERSMLEEEVNSLFISQKRFHKNLTDAVCSEITQVIFYQRALRPQVPGACTFELKEKRIARAHPLYQRFRLLQEVNNLQVLEGHLRPEQREIVKQALNKKEKLTFDQIRRQLKIGSNSYFNLETTNKAYLQGNRTNAVLAKKDYFGQSWFNLSLEVQNDIVELLLAEENEDSLINKIMEKSRCSWEAAIKVIDADLEEGYGALSRKAIEKILPHLEKGLVYSDACEAAGYHHSDFRPGKLLSKLPYYGEILRAHVIGGQPSETNKAYPEKFFGKITNPTVHVGLNQLRKLINEIIQTYGQPQEIMIELARELKMSAKDVRKIESEQRKNQEKNREIDEHLEQLGVDPSYDNRMIFKIWESLGDNPLNRCCPFTGETIAKEALFSGGFQVEHLVPFSVSYNDSINNKVICRSEANIFKNNRTPYDAFGHSPANYDWQAIYARAAEMKMKFWAFQPDVLEKMKGTHADLIARQLTDTQYFSRIAKEYLAHVCERVYSNPGRLTAMLRARWGLNSILGGGDKNRADHRHHTIDAFVVACVSRRMLQQISAASENAFRRNRLIERMPLPFEGFDRNALANSILNVIVSHKPDHGLIRRLHADTAYGSAGVDESEQKLFVNRIPLTSIKNESDIALVCDAVWRKRLTSILQGVPKNSEEWKRKLDELSKSSGIKKIRIRFPMSSGTYVGISDDSGYVYKYYATDGNFCMDIYEPRKGKHSGKWCAEVITAFNANQPDFVPEWRRNYPAARRIMRLFIHDAVAIGQSDQMQIYRVQKIDGGDSCRVYFVGHSTAVLPAGVRYEVPPMSASQLQLKKVRKVSVDMLGRVKDPLRSMHGRTNH